MKSAIFIAFLAIFITVGDCHRKILAVCERVDVAFEDPAFYKSKMHVSKISPTGYVYNMEAELFRNVTRDLGVTVYAEFSNRYQRLPLVVKKNICDRFSNELMPLVSLIKRYSIMASPCPILAGKFWVRNAMFDEAEITIQIMPWRKMMYQILLEDSRGRLLTDHRIYVRFNDTTNNLNH